MEGDPHSLVRGVGPSACCACEHGPGLGIESEMRWGFCLPGTSSAKRLPLPTLTPSPPTPMSPGGRGRELFPLQWDRVNQTPFLHTRTVGGKNRAQQGSLCRLWMPREQDQSLPWRSRQAHSWVWPGARHATSEARPMGRWAQRFSLEQKGLKPGGEGLL